MTRPLRLPRPKGTPPGIGIVGAGEIVAACHLPAYRDAGFPVVALHDLDANRARAVGAAFGVRATDTLDALLTDPAIGVIDIAVPVTAQDMVARRAIAAGKHVLCQKPLALDAGAAAGLAQAARAAGVKAAVNQQMRYAPAMAAVRANIAEGAIGNPIAARFDVNVFTPWERWRFWHAVPHFELFGHSIHYLDMLRAVLGQPDRVDADVADAPGRGVPGPIRTNVRLVYPGALRAIVTVDHDAVPDTSDWRTDFRFEGTAGVLKGSLGALFDYPRGRPDTLAAFDRRHPERGWQHHELAGRWFPDAFAGTMGELLLAIEEDRAPAENLDDGVATIALVEAVARAADERRQVALAQRPGVEPDHG